MDHRDGGLLATESLDLVRKREKRDGGERIFLGFGLLGIAFFRAKDMHTPVAASRACARIFGADEENMCEATVG